MNSRKIKVILFSFVGLSIVSSFTNCASGDIDYSSTHIKYNLSKRAKVVHYINVADLRSQDLIASLLKRGATQSQFIREYVVLVGDDKNLKSNMARKGYTIVPENTANWRGLEAKMPFYVLFDERTQSQTFGHYNINPVTHSVNFFLNFKPTSNVE